MSVYFKWGEFYNTDSCWVSVCKIRIKKYEGCSICNVYDTSKTFDSNSELNLTLSESYLNLTFSDDQNRIYMFWEKGKREYDGYNNSVTFSYFKNYVTSLNVCPGAFEHVIFSAQNVVYDVIFFSKLFQYNILIMSTRNTSTLRHQNLYGFINTW